jgi:hypothetical protein
VALNPMGYPPQVTQLGMAPRLDTLDDKTVYLVDLHYNDSGSLLEQMRVWFAEHVPRANILLVQKSGQFMADDPALFQEIQARGDAMIMAVGH